MIEKSFNMVYYIYGDYMKYKILNLLKERKDFVSGREIGEQFNVSRTAVWKNIAKLKEEGYNIISVSNRGYKLENNVDILNENEIKYRPLLFLDETTSTNEIAKNYANDGCEDGFLVVTDNQTAGRGRLGRVWQCEKSAALCMSVVLKPDIMPYEAPQITLVAGIACAKAINKITGLDGRIKWPNDIIINGRKVTGILTEMSAEIERVKYVVVGIGVNINNEHFDDEIKDKATSVFIETGIRHKRSVFADEITNELISLYKIYCEKGLSALVDEYNSLCINVGRYVKTVGREEIEGKALGINEKGEILIETEHGIKAVLSGEVSLRLQDNRYI